jgi:hypothetical protein
VAFEKLDGTNLHWDWEREFGWHSFGTRRDEFDLSPAGGERCLRAHPNLAGCVDAFQATLADGLEFAFRNSDSLRSFVGFRVFVEWVGPNSFAGMHRAGDPMEVVLFDVEAIGFGMLGPDQFLAEFGHLNSARVVYRGKFTGQFAEDVRRGKYGVDEGVVCKGGGGGPDLWMAKIKTLAYLERLRQAFAERWEDYWE